MRLFGYYAVHAVFNQIKKLCRTWVVVFILVCALGGGLIGVGVAMLEDKAEENNADEIEEVIDDEPIDPAEMAQRLELIAGAAILALFIYEALSAEKNGSAIFQPADVALLFPSPMKPQGVLMFRLGTQIGMAVFAGLYMLLQLPNLTVNLGSLDGYSKTAQVSVITGNAGDRDVAKPEVKSLEVGETFTYEMPKFSFSVIRIKK